LATGWAGEVATVDENLLPLPWKFETGRSAPRRRPFENCVTACRNCNERLKKNHTPQEAGMLLIRKPTVPKSRKGDIAIVTFTFNPHNEAHKTYYEALGVSFSHVA
jgi:hypothetical protein